MGGGRGREGDRDRVGGRIRSEWEEGEGEGGREGEEEGGRGIEVNHQCAHLNNHHSVHTCTYSNNNVHSSVKP